CKTSKKVLLPRSRVNLLPNRVRAKQMRARPVKSREVDHDSVKRSKARSSWAIARLRRTIQSEIRSRKTLKMSTRRMMKRATKLMARGMPTGAARIA
ncbi:hypothetical protein, partial [Streptococcus suis]|uniref:hypothetical protein n=1 Tax=Streptococcus suis TaxID=1307 RepID=UPI001EE6FAA7